MSRRKYTFEERLQVVMHYFTTDEGYRLTSARFDVPRTQVRLWVAAYDAYGEEGLKSRDKESLLTLRSELKLLELYFQVRFPKCRRLPNLKLLAPLR